VCVCGCVCVCVCVLGPLCVGSREKTLGADGRARPDSSVDTVWVDLSNPVDADRGKYTLELFDGQDSHRRHLDLSGQGGRGLARLLPLHVDIIIMIIITSHHHFFTFCFISYYY